MTHTSNTERNALNYSWHTVAGSLADSLEWRRRSLDREKMKKDGQVFDERSQRTRRVVKRTCSSRFCEIRADAALSSASRNVSEQLNFCFNDVWMLIFGTASEAVGFVLSRTVRYAAPVQERFTRRDAITVNRGTRSPVQT